MEIKTERGKKDLFPTWGSSKGAGRGISPATNIQVFWILTRAKPIFLTIFFSKQIKYYIRDSS